MLKVFLILALSTAITTSPLPDRYGSNCAAGDLRIIDNSGKPKPTCNFCYGARFSEKGQCEENPAPEADNCSLYHRDRPGCSWCNKGFASQGYLTEMGDGVCKPLKIPDCQMGVHFDEGSACLVCDGGFPNEDNQECQKFGNQKLFENCAWGFRDRDDFYCVRCQEGFMAVKDGICSETPIQGCMLAKTGGEACLLCDAFDGWFLSGDGSACVKRLTEEQLEDGSAVEEGQWKANL